jgi:hypothetical protein
MVMGELCPFLRVIFLAGLVVPSAWFPKETLVGNAVTLWASAAWLLTIEKTIASKKTEARTAIFRTP